jgi:hypothetical protein
MQASSPETSLDSRSLQRLRRRRLYPAIIMAAASSVVLVAGDAGAGESPTATSARAGPASAVALDASHSDPPHRCPCGVDCGGSCCCTRRISPSPRAEATSHPEPATSRSQPGSAAGPCARSVPCGQGTIPSSLPAGFRLLDSAFLSAQLGATGDQAGRPWPVRAARLAGQGSPDPLEKPPRLHSPA